MSWFVPQELPEAKLLCLVYLCVNQAGTDSSIYRSLGINREQLVLNSRVSAMSLF